MKTSWLAAAISAALSTIAGAAAPVAQPSATMPATTAGDQDVRLLAAALALPPDRLLSVTALSERLLDGREIRSIKAIDRDSGDLLGHSFHNGAVVEAERLREEANRLWRFGHGAMSPTLVEQLTALRMDERIVVDLWFAFTPPDDGGGPSGSVLPSSQYSGDRAPANAAVRVNADGKGEHLPLPPAQAQAVLAQIAAAATQVSPAMSDGADKVIAPGAASPDLARNKAEAIAAIARVEADNQQRIAQVQAALAPVRAAMTQKLANAGVTVIYASELVPSIVLEATRAQIELMARWSEVARIDPEGRNAGPSLDIARHTHNATPLNAVGYDGSGVTTAVVEGGRVYALNPFLTVSQSRDTNVAVNTHSTGVGGVIASTHATHRGMAPGTTLISADGQYNVSGSLEAAADWAAARAQVMNHSWGFKEVAANTFNAFDRRLDWIGRVNFRLQVHAAGNNGAANCGQSAPNINTAFGTESPGRGYNTLAVGGFDDLGTVGWPGDVRYNCSATGWSRGDSAGGDHEKPEIAAGAVSITSLAHTTSSTSPLSGGWTGTSFAAPAVAGIAADLMEADAQLAGSPVATRALLLVGALRNAAETRTVSATASAFATELGPWSFHGVDANTAFPLSYQVYARAGQRVRFAINWNSNLTLNNGVFSNDHLPADLDLTARRSDGTFVAVSNTYNNPFELVDFIAPITDTYQFRVTRFGNWTGGATPYAAAAQIDGYLMPQGTWWTWGNGPRPQGMFYGIRPDQEYAGWVPYWRGVSLRPATADYDLELYDTSWLDTPANATDPFNRVNLATSRFGGNAVDFILVDGNHWPATKREHYRALHYTGSGPYAINAAPVIGLGDAAGVFGPYSMDGNTSLITLDVLYQADSDRRFKLLPAGGGAADIGLALFRSNGAVSGTWAQPRTGALVVADSAGVGGGESLRYRYNGTGSDYLGVAVYNKTPGSTPQFYLQVQPSSLFFGGFESD